MNEGGEALLPPYLCRLARKHVSESIKNNIITIQVRNIEYNNSHCVPLPFKLLNTINKIKYISEDPDITYCTAQKGLTLLGVALLDDDEISLSTSFMNTFQAHHSPFQNKPRKFPRSPLSCQPPRKASWNSSRYSKTYFMHYSLHPDLYSWN